MPDRAAPGGSAHDGKPSAGDLVAVVALGRRLVGAERKRVWCPRIRPHERDAPLGRKVEEGGIARHVAAGVSLPIGEEIPLHMDYALAYSSVGGQVQTRFRSP